MGCGCNNGPVNSWYDIFTTMPANPLDVVAYADLGGMAATFSNSSNFGAVSGAWVVSPWTITGEPVAASLAADQLATIAAANQWNFSHQTDNVLATMAPPLRKVIFLKAGTMWQNLFQIQMGGATYDDIQLSFRDNAGTRGDSAGTTPVVSFTGTHTGLVILTVTLNRPGQAIMGLRARHVASGDYSMFEMEWNIVE